MFKECLKHNIVPFIITEQTKLFYYRGLKEWNYERGYLRDTCLMAQDQFKLVLDYFKIEYEKQNFSNFSRKNFFYIYVEICVTMNLEGQTYGNIETQSMKSKGL